MASKKETVVKEAEENRITVAVSLRVDVIKSYGEVRDALDENLFRWLTLAGCMPMPVPNTLIEENLLERWFEKVNPGAIVLSGGNNIGEIGNRDETELFLLEKAKSEKIPLLGICRGMQMIAVWAGEKLHPVEGHVGTRHQLKSELVNKHLPESVNSYHDFGLLSVPDHFDIIARDEDGVIEALCHKELPIEGWMWHPEREQEFSTIDLENFKRLINKQ